MDEISGVPGRSELRLTEAVVDVRLSEALAEPVLRCERRVFHYRRDQIHIAAPAVSRGI